MEFNAEKHGGRPADDEQAVTPEEYAKLVALYDDSMRNLTEGEIVRGRVIGITNNEVIVDVGYKSEGLIPLEEFRDLSGKLTVQEGDEVEVLLEKAEDLEGHVLLSKTKAERMRVWTDVENSFKEGKIIKGRVIDRIKGGLTVDVGVRAFLPGSLVDIKPVKNLESLRGRELEFKVISLDRRRNNIVLSRKAVLEKEYEKKKADTLGKLREGVVLPGVVKNITDYGVFIDLGGIDGLLHITDISWGRVNHPSEHFSGRRRGRGRRPQVRPRHRARLAGLQAEDRGPLDRWSTRGTRSARASRARWCRSSTTAPSSSSRRASRASSTSARCRGRRRWSTRRRSRTSATRSRRSSPSSTWSSAHQPVAAPDRAQSVGGARRAAIPSAAIIEGKVRNLTDFGAFVEITEGSTA
jgi:transcriptional accessory protein Tex/SPT6